MTDRNKMHKLCGNCGNPYGEHYHSTVLGKPPYCFSPSVRKAMGRKQTFIDMENPIANELDDLFDSAIDEICGPEKKKVDLGLDYFGDLEERLKQKKQKERREYV